jgi:hypothetical protein
MGVHINDDSMSLEIGGATVNAAVRLDNLWRVTGWPRLLSRNEAITALTLAEWCRPGVVVPGVGEPPVVVWLDRDGRRC